MKRKILMTIVLFVVTATAFAQFSGGLKAGMNIGYEGWTSEDDDFDESMTGIGYHVGAVLNYKFSKRIGIQTEFIYSATSFKPDEEDSPNLALIYALYFEDDKVTVTNISFPLLFVYSFDSWNLEGGVQYSMRSTNPTEPEKGYLYKESGVDFLLGASAAFGDTKKFFGSIRMVIADVGGEVTDGSDLVIADIVGQLSIGYKLFGKEKD